MIELARIELAQIEAARARIAGSVVRTPLVRLHVENAPAEIYLKLENLQPINSFKIRGAANAVMLAPASARAEGLVTASAGNMAQGVAWMARELGVPATIVVPDHAPEAKLAAIERLGGRVLKIPYDAWWEVIVTSHLDGLDGLFVHPVQDPADPGHRRGSGRARSRGRAERPGRDRQGRVRGLGRQHQPGQTRRDPRRILGVTRRSGSGPRADGRPRRRCCSG